MNKSATVSVFDDGSAELHVFVPADGGWGEWNFLEPPVPVQLGDLERVLKMLLADGVVEIILCSA